MKKANILLCLAAGLLGGLLSHFVWIQLVHAQSHATAPKELRAQSFVLVNGDGEVRAVLTYAKPEDAPVAVKLYNADGREIWSAGGRTITQLARH